MALQAGPDLYCSTCARKKKKTFSRDSAHLDLI